MKGELLNNRHCLTVESVSSRNHAAVDCPVCLDAESWHLGVRCRLLVFNTSDKADLPIISRALGIDFLPGDFMFICVILGAKYVFQPHVQG